MSDAGRNDDRKTQPSRRGGPPRPPKKTARGLEGDSPEDANRLAAAHRILREYDEKMIGPKLTAAQREKVIWILTHPGEPLE